MLLRFQKAAVRGNYETGNQAFSMRLRSLTIRHSRNVPADNNRSERELRPTVIARKISFGSQSEAGAKTREIIMSLLHTLRKWQQHAEDYFKSVLDRLASDIKQDAVSLLFSASS